MRFQKTFAKIISESSNLKKKYINIPDMYEFGVKKTILETMLRWRVYKINYKRASVSPYEYCFIEFNGRKNWRIHNISCPLPKRGHHV